MKTKFGDQAFVLYHKILTRATKYYVAGHIWPAGRQFDIPDLHERKMITRFVVLFCF